jgi:hypothetical protein
MENSISLRLGTKNQQVLMLIGFISGAMIFIIKLCWWPLMQACFGNEIGHDNQPVMLGFLYRNIYLIPWCAALCLAVYGLLKKNIVKTLAYTVGLIFSWIVFLLGMMVFFFFWGKTF